MKTIRRLMMFGGAAFTAAILLICPLVQAQTPKKVLLIPFTLYSNEDLAYLQKGIGRMLTSRLTRQGEVEVLQADPTMAKTPNPVDQAKAMGAGYLVTGSLTLSGNSVSTDAKVMDLQQGKQVLTFSRVGKDRAVIIDHVDQLAARISTELFGHRVTAVTPEPSTAAAPVTKAPEPSIHQHPEKLIIQPDESDRLKGEVTGPAPDASLMMRGRRVPYQIRGVTTGDVDGDGQNDIVCIGPSIVVVYGVVQNELIKKVELEKKSGHYVGVDAVDVNGNGKVEIFVTNFFKIDSRVTSFVLEWDGKKLAEVAGNLKWFFRAVEVPGRGKILAGQRQGISESFAENIHAMGWQGGSYGPVERLPLPRGLNIYGFAYGNMRSDHDTEVAAYNPGGFVRILDPSGQEQWISSERYGGSSVFIELPDKTDTSETLYVYLSPRIHLFDMDGDGRQEIFVIDNEDISGAFDRVRLFKNGRLEALKWDGLGLVPQWRTRNLAKYMSDFAFADMDGDGRPEVVASVVQKSKGVFLSKARSYLAVFKLTKPPRKKES